MKNFKKLALAGIVGISLAGGAVVAGESDPAGSGNAAGGEHVLPPTPPAPPADAVVAKPGGLEIIKDIPERSKLADEIKRMLEDFRNDREARTAELKKLRESILGATKDQKEQVRNKVREILQAQKLDAEHIKEVVREQVRERMEQLGKDLPSRKEILDAAKEKFKEQKPRSRGE